MKMPKNLKIVVVEPKKEPYVKEIPFDLHSIQNVVGGHFETIPFGRLGSLLIINEMGKLLGLPQNRVMKTEEYEWILNGTFFVCGQGYYEDIEEYDFASLTDDQINEALKCFSL